MKHFLCIVILLSLLQLPIHASDPINDLYSSLPDAVTSAFPKDFESEVKSDGVSAVSSLDAQYAMSFVFKTV